MHHHHSLDPTTHTVELDQLRELDAALGESPADHLITADLLGMTGAHVKQGVSQPATVGTLPASAVLLRLSYDGPPEYPYIHGHFSGSGGEGVAELHTAALQALARQLHLNQRWGV